MAHYKIRLTLLALDTTMQYHPTAVGGANNSTYNKQGSSGGNTTEGSRWYLSSLHDALIGSPIRSDDYLNSTDLRKASTDGLHLVTVFSGPTTFK